MRTVLLLLAVSLTLMVPPRAWAQSAAPPSITYSAPASCPSEAAFLRRLQSRLGPSGATGAARTLSVRIALLEARYVGTLSLSEAGGRATTKTLSDRDCEGLVDALSLVTALALEGNAIEGSDGDRSSVASSVPSPPSAQTSTSTNTPSAAPAASNSATAATQANSTNAPLATQANSMNVPAASNSATTQAPSESGPEPGAPTASRIGVALGGLAAVGPAPNPLFGAAFTLHWVMRDVGPFTPSLELGGEASRAADATESKGTASFTWLAVRATAYVVRWAFGAGVVLRGGVTGDFGVLLASGRDTVSPAASSRPWSSLGAVAGLELPLGAVFAIQPTVGVEAPLRRDRYAFGSTDFFQVPPVVATIGASLIAYVH
jgi:hypothetical protein